MLSKLSNFNVSMYGTMIEDINNNDFVGSAFSDVSYVTQSSQAKSADFIEETTYRVPVSELYEVIKTCNRHEGNQHCGVLLKIINEKLSELYDGASHLVQVWSKNGEKVYEKAFNCGINAYFSIEDPIAEWDIFPNHFVFMPSPDVPENDFLFVIKLDEHGAEEMRVQNFVKGDTSFHNLGVMFKKSKEYLVTTNTDNVRFVNLDSLEKCGSDGRERAVKEEEIVNYRLDQLAVEPFSPRDEESEQTKQIRIITFMDIGSGDVGLLLESDDNQICFHRIEIYGKNKLKLLELASVVPRHLSMTSKMLSSDWVADPIEDYKTVMFFDVEENAYQQCGISIRESGCLDFYSNFRLVESTKFSYAMSKPEMYLKKNKDQETLADPGKFTSVTADFGCLYFRDKRDMYRCPMNWKSRIGLSVSKQVTVENSKVNDNAKLETIWARIKESSLNQYLKLFPTFVLFFTKMLIAHANFVSVYDLIENSWNRHFEFDAPVKQIWRHMECVQDNDFNCGVFLENGKVKLLGLKIKAIKNKKKNRVDQALLDLDNPSGGQSASVSRRKALQQQTEKVEERVYLIQCDTFKVNGKIVDYRCENQVTNECRALYVLADPMKQKEKPITIDQIKVTSINDEESSRVNEEIDEPIERPIIADPNDQADGKKVQNVEDSDHKSPQGLDLYVYTQQQLIKVQDVGFIPRGSSISVQQSVNNNQRRIIIDSKQLKTLTSFEVLESDTGFITLKKADDSYEYKLRKVDDNLIQDMGTQERNLVAAMVPHSKAIAEHEHNKGNEGARLMNMIVSADPSKAKKGVKHKFHDAPTVEDGLDTSALIIDGDIQLFTPDKKVKKLVHDRKIRSSLMIETWMYSMSDKFNVWNNKMNNSNEEQSLNASGLYIYDYKRMLKTGKIETYKIRESIVGVNATLDFSPQLQRLSFLSDFANIDIVPIPHRNTLRFFGMRPKSDYLIWHQEKGSFTALDKFGYVTTWNIATGKICEDKSRTMKEIKHASHIIIDDYSIFEGDSQDFSYKREWNNRGDYSIQLLVEDEPSYQFFKSQSLSGDDINMFKSDQGKEFDYRNYKVLLLKNQEVSVEMEFRHHYYPSQNADDTKICQRLYFSKDLQKMLERNADSICTIYQRQNQENSSQVKWKILSRIKRYPSLLAGITSKNCLFTPNFEYFLDVDYTMENFVIRSVENHGQIITILPNGMLSLSTKGASKSKNAIQKLAKRIVFEDEDHIRVINKGGLDCFCNFKTMTIVSACQIDNFDVNDYDHKHCIYDQSHIPVNQIMKRLVRIAEQFKAAQYLYRQVLHSLPQQEYNMYLYEYLFKVDYSMQEDKDEQHDFFSAELSFTYIDWHIAERVMQQRDFQLQNIDEAQQLQLCFNIFPGIQQIFHSFVMCKNVTFDTNSINLLYKIAAKNKVKKYIVPMFENKDKQTPLDLVFNAKDKVRGAGKGKSKVNVNTAYMFLNNIKDYPFGHSGEIINRIIPKAIKKGVPGMEIFLDARFKQSLHLVSESLKKKGLKKELVHTVNNFNYVCIPASIWKNKDQLEEQVFSESALKKSIILEYFDLPGLHYNTALADSFWKVLAEADDLDLFETRAIQVMINHKWPIYNRGIRLRFFYPYVVFLFLFSVWSNFIFENRQNGETYRKANDSLASIMIAFALYYLYTEFKQGLSTGISYFWSPWNYLDILPLLLLINNSIFSYDMFVLDADLQIMIAVFQAFTGVLMWFKLIYFMRVNDSTGWLVRLIYTVIYDMSSFLLIMTITIVAYSDAFYSISQFQSNYVGEEYGFISDYGNALVYTYNMVLGDYDTSQYVGPTTVFALIFFFTCTLFNLIVMLNLLIAIISDTYMQVTSVQNQAFYQEKAAVISEHFYMEKESSNDLDTKKNELLLIIQEKEKIALENQQTTIVDVLDSIKSVKDLIKKNQLDMQALHKKVDKTNNEIVTFKQNQSQFNGGLLSQKGQSKSYQKKKDESSGSDGSEDQSDDHSDN